MKHIFYEPKLIATLRLIEGKVCRRENVMKLSLFFSDICFIIFELVIDSLDIEYSISVNFQNIGVVLCKFVPNSTRMYIFVSCFTAMQWQSNIFIIVNRKKFFLPGIYYLLPSIWRLYLCRSLNRYHWRAFRFTVWPRNAMNF